MLLYTSNLGYLALIRFKFPVVRDFGLELPVEYLFTERLPLSAEMAAAVKTNLIMLMQYALRPLL